MGHHGGEIVSLTLWCEPRNLDHSLPDDRLGEGERELVGEESVSPKNTSGREIPSSVRVKVKSDGASSRPHTSPNSTEYLLGMRYLPPFALLCGGRRRRNPVNQPRHTGTSHLL